MSNQGLMKGWTDPTTFSGQPPAAARDQLALFPRKTQFEFSPPDGKDIWGLVEADNDRIYYLKLDRGDRPIRASEWLCYQIARLVGVLTPDCEFIQTNNGDIAFGSEGVNGASNQADTVLFLERYTMIELGSSAPGLQAALSAIHAFDLFVHNLDRHLGNFLVVGRGPEKQLLALDFARALFWQWPWNDFFSSDSTSGQAWADLRHRHGFDLDAAQLVVNRLGIIQERDIARLLDQMPAHWLSTATRNDLLRYCREGDWAARVARLRKGFGDGSIV